MEKFYIVENFIEYIKDNYNYELSCGEQELFFTLQQSQERVLEWINYDFCNCECNYNCNCFNVEELIEEAIYILSFSRLKIDDSDDEDQNYKNAELTAFRFLKNRGAIYYG